MSLRFLKNGKKDETIGNTEGTGVNQRWRSSRGPGPF